jgi:hypothetical protein
MSCPILFLSTSVDADVADSDVGLAGKAANGWALDG